MSVVVRRYSPYARWRIGAGAAALGGLLFACSGESDATPEDSPDASATAGSGDTAGDSAAGAGASGTTSASERDAAVGSGGDGGSGTAGATAAPDAAGQPVPFEPDLTGLVETSARYLLFTERHDALGPEELLLLDLDTGTRHLTNPDGPLVAYTGWSTDGDTVMIADSNAVGERGPFLLRLTDRGFVPALEVQGYAGERGNYSAFEWSADNRFVLFRRGGSTSDGIELVDGARGERMDHVEVPNGATVFAQFAPAGFAHNYVYYPMPGQGVGFVASLGADGHRTARHALRQGAGLALFNAAGEVASYWFRDGDSLRAEVLVLPDRVEPLAATEGDEQLARVLEPAADGQSVLVVTERADGTGLLKRVYRDGRASEPLSDPARNFDYPAAPRSGRPYALAYDGSVELVDFERGLRFELPITETRAPNRVATVGFAGEHLHYGGQDGLHLVAIDADGTLRDDVIEGGHEVEVCAPSRPFPTVGKAALRIDDGAQIVLLDTTQIPARVAGRVSPTASGQSLTCPFFEHGGPGLAFHEARDAGSAYLIARWAEPAADVEPAVAMLESDGIVDLVALRLR